MILILIGLLLAFTSAFIGSIVLMLIEKFEKKLTGKLQTYDLLEAYFKFRKKDFIFLEENNKIRLNRILHFSYYTLWGIILPFIITLIVPRNIQTIGSLVALWYLIIIIIVYFLVAHFSTLILTSIYLNKDNPFWKWGIKNNLTLALEKFAYSIVTVTTYLFLSTGFVLLFIII